MKVKLARRLFATCLVLALSVGLLCTNASAATFAGAAEIIPANGTGNDGKIVVTVYNNNPDHLAGTGAETTVQDADPIKDVGINALRIGTVVELTSIGKNGAVSTQVAFGLTETYVNLLKLETASAITSQSGTYYFTPAKVQAALGTAIQPSVEAYLDHKQNGAINKVTLSDGTATFENLDYGLYLLAKSSLPANATTDLVPFLVSVPMYVESTHGNAWQTTVYAYPKVRTADITISKTVDDQDTAAYADGDIYVSAGQTLQYTVTTTIPAADTGNGSPTRFTSFVITDTNPHSTLDIDTASVEVKLGATELACTPAYDGSILTLTLTENDLLALNADLSQAQTITVTYDATVATDVTFASKITNIAKATYQRTGMTGPADAAVAANTSNTVNLYTYGLDLTKTLSDSGAITENMISFALYETYENGTFNDPVPIKAGSGGYWQEASAADPDTNTYTMYVNVSGELNLYGLEPGTYYLKETATMEGYTLLAEPITIVITAAGQQQGGDPAVTATVNGAAAQVANGVVFLSVENTKNEAGFTLPQTGGAGTLALTAIGLGLLCAGVILLVVYRRKGQKNS